MSDERGLTPGRIIRAQGRILEPVVAQAAEEAATIRKGAEAELSAARATIETWRKSAEDAGHAEGLASGRQAALAECTALLVAARLDAEAVRAESRGGIVALGRRLAERILGRAVAMDESLLAELANLAIADARVRSGTVVLRVHPEDSAAMERQRPALMSRLSEQVVLRIESDAAVERHGCVVQTPGGRVDAQLSTQLDALEKALAEAARRSSR